MVRLISGAVREWAKISKPGFLEVFKKIIVFHKR
jgi:hypothetical protein